MDSMSVHIINNHFAYINCKIHYGPVSRPFHSSFSVNNAHSTSAAVYAGEGFRVVQGQEKGEWGGNYSHGFHIKWVLFLPL